MEEILKANAMQTSNEMLKSMTVKVTLEGWPCAIAIIGLGVAYVVSERIRFDASGIIAKRKFA